MATDLAWVTWAGEQFGVTYDHLRHVNAAAGAGPVISDSAVRQRVGRLVSMGLVTKHKALGVMWVTPTRAGYDLVGQRYAIWQPSPSRLAHCDSVNRVRLWYESSPDRVAEQGEWVSERRLLQQRGRAGSWHVADGELRRPGSSEAMSVEVELHCKQPARRYVDEVFTKLHPQVGSVLYLCPPPILARVQRSVRWAVDQSGMASGLRVYVRPLPSLCDSDLRSASTP